MNDDQKSLNLAEKIMAARVNKRLSQPELSEKSGIPQSQISKVERAQIADPGFWTVVQLAKTLDIDIQELADPNTDYRGLKAIRPLYPSRQLIIENYLSPNPGLIALGSLDADDASNHYVGMRNEELNKHLLITGRTGSGKTELMKHTIRDTARTDNAIILIDPNGELANEVINDLLNEFEEIEQRIIFLDFSNDAPPAINPLIVNSLKDISQRVQTLMNVFSKQMGLQGEASPRAVNYLQQALVVLIEANLLLPDDQKITVLDVPNFFLDVQFRQMALHLCSNIAIREAFDPETGPYEQMTSKKQLEHVMPLIRVFEPISRSIKMRSCLSSGLNTLELENWIKNGKIIIVKGARFSHQKLLAEFISSLIVNLVGEKPYEWGKQRNSTTGKITGRGTRLFIDEAHSVLSDNDNIIALLAEARKWDLGVIVSVQFLKQFSKPTRQALLANTANKISCALDITAGGEMAQSIDQGAGLLDIRTLAQLPNYRAYANLLVGSDQAIIASGPFLLKLLPPKPLDYTKLQTRYENLITTSNQFHRNSERDLNQVKATLSKVIQQNIRPDDDDDDDDDLAGFLAKI